MRRCKGCEDMGFYPGTGHNARMDRWAISGFPTHDFVPVEGGR